MNKLLTILSFIVISNLISAQETKVREFDSSPYGQRIVNSNFTVLDIDYESKLLAFKHVFEFPEVFDELGELYYKPCNCHYVGMDSLPLAGVVLGVYDLSKQEYLKTFIIYQAVHDTADCTKYDLSQKMLDSAKLFFKEHNLDFNKKPKYENLYVVGDSIKTFIYNDVEFSYFSKRCEENVYFDMTTYSELYARKNGSIHTPKLIYSIYQEDKYYMAGQGFINYQSAYAENGYFIF